MSGSDNPIEIRETKIVLNLNEPPVPVRAVIEWVPTPPPGESRPLPPA